MAQLVSFSHERLHRFGKEAAERAKRKEKFPQSAVLTCEYLGVPIGEGRFDAACAATTDASFAFEWRVKACGYEAAHVTTVRCDHLAGRGVSFPPGWHVALQNLDLDEYVAKEVERVIARSKVPNARCHLLGRAQRTCVADLQHTPGAFVVIDRVEHVLCAHIVDDEWFAHRGSFDGEVFCEETPLRPQDLIHVRITTACMEPPRRKRIPTHLHVGQLRDFIGKKPCDFDVLVAVATYRAETIRSQRQTREIDLSAATRKFERNPFAWTEADSQLWNLVLVARWSWQTRGAEREAFITVRLHKLRQRGLPGPPDIGDRDYRLWRDLEQVAASETTQRKAPCKYLGQRTGERFEPDPAKWNVIECPDGWKAHAKVWFEWLYVSQGSAPYRSSCRADDVVTSGRFVPWNPLSQISFTGLAVTKEFMKTVAVNTHPGVLFKGIVLESERADIKSQLPNDGIDIFHESVYWTASSLPNTRHV